MPFSIDSPSFPTALNPGEIATFSVGFHPTQIGKISSKTLSITLPQLRDPLTIELSGEGVAPGPDGDAGPGSNGLSTLSTTSFYACSCTANDPLGRDRDHARGVRRPGAPTAQVVVK